MHLSDILSAEHVYIDVDCSSKKKLLEKICDILASYPQEIDVNVVYESLLNREKLGSTGIGAGVAIPHSRLQGINEVLCCLLTLADPIDFDAIDGKKVDIVFALVVPENATDDHLQLLAAIAETLATDAILQGIRNTTSAEALYNLIVYQGA